MNKYMGAKHLSNSTVGELQRVNNFLVEITGLDETITMLIKGFPLPESENEVLTIKHGNTAIKLPGPLSFASGDMTIYDSINLDTEAKLAAWRAEVCDPRTSALGIASQLKRDAVVTEFSPNGEIGRQWKYEGLWPSAFKPGELAADGSDVKSMSLTLQYDRAYRLDGKVK